MAKRHSLIPYLVAAAIAVFLLLALGISVAEQSRGYNPNAMPCGDAELEKKIHNIMEEAIETAYKTHIEHVFEIWMKDDTRQPGRAATGVRQGTNAYIRSREAALSWKLPRCP